MAIDAPPQIDALPEPRPDRFGGAQFDNEMQAWLSQFPIWTDQHEALGQWSYATALEVASLTAVATGAAGTATTKAGQAAASAEAAQTYSDTALGYRNEANAHKNAAAGSAAAANTSAGIASTKAYEAAASAASIAGGPVASWNGLTGIITQSQVYTTVRSAVLTGLSTATSTAVVATDSLIVAIGKLVAGLALKANLASPALTGTPTAPTAAAADSSTKLATTEHVKNQFAAGANGNGAYFTAPRFQMCRQVMPIPANSDALWTFPLAFTTFPPQVVATGVASGGSPTLAVWTYGTATGGVYIANPNGFDLLISVLAIQ